MAKRVLHQGIVGAGIAVLVAISLVRLSASQVTNAAIAIDGDDIGGIVTSTAGPEAGVWVIAETTDLPTKFVRIVVTDDRGRYVLPDMPKANYNVWVRGYGLVDSRRVQTAPGKTVNLTAVVAPNAREAAQYYPANYWWSMLQVPATHEFPGTGAKGNGINENVKSQSQWLMRMRTEGCLGCHLMGSKATREIPPSLGTFANTAAAWDRRVQSGQNGAGMLTQLNNLGRQRMVAMFADWSDRIKAGELPPTPPRPQGRERNVVITMWDWADPKSYLHDPVSSDKRNPRVNANGPVYGSLEAAADYLPVIDPQRNTLSRLPLQVRDPKSPPVSAFMPQPSPYWGEEAIWTSRTSAHSFAMDGQGRVWTAQKIRPNETPEFCRTGSNHPSAKLFPINESGRQVSVYDPKTKQFTLVDLCFATHHLAFAEDANNSLWFCSGGGEVVGWLNTKMFDETKDEAKSQSWTAFILDTNGNGKRDAYVEPNEPIDPTKDKRILSPFYGVIPSPVDGSIWGSVLGFPGSVVRLNLGSNPPATTLAEIYELPYGNPAASIQGYGPRGIDIDRNGVVWTGVSSGHLASFDRRKCKAPLNGPKATGQHCPEGWTFYPMPGPQFKGVKESGSADSGYYNWVDQHNTLGLGANVPIAPGSEGLMALSPETKQFTTLRVPYPQGFYAKLLDGRIDDPQAGWKGRGVWSTYSTKAIAHIEGGRGTTSKLVKFQLRPDPLAK
jgi:hypothetical protein